MLPTSLTFLSRRMQSYSVQYLRSTNKRNFSFIDVSAALYTTHFRYRLLSTTVHWSYRIRRATPTGRTGSNSALAAGDHPSVSCGSISRAIVSSEWAWPMQLDGQSVL